MDKALLHSLPVDFQILLADVGSAGGLHKRWAPLRDHVSAILFDPLEETKGSDRDRYFPFALAGAAGRATLNVTRRATMTSTLLPDAELFARFWHKARHTEIVATRDIAVETLDHLIEQAGITLDAIKIDVQGGEHDVIRGARRCLARSVMLAEIEVSFFERYAGLHPIQEIIPMMGDLGFDLVDISRIKRYRYANRSGVVNPGLGRGDRAGRLAFCDAIFLRRDDRLRDAVCADNPVNGPHAALKALLILLVYGKADIAAWLFDAVADRLPTPARDAFAAYFKRLGGRHFGRRGLHLAIDYIARRV